MYILYIYVCLYLQTLFWIAYLEQLYIFGPFLTSKMFGVEQF